MSHKSDAFPEVEPVWVENRAIIYDPSRMEINKVYPVEVLGRLHLVRKTKENMVEMYELEPIGSGDCRLGKAELKILAENK